MVVMNVQKLTSTALLAEYEQAAAELGILQVSDAPSEELKNVRETLDDLMLEITRRMSW